MAVITISRQFGAGGKTLAKMISEHLGYTFADSNVIQRIAKEANVSKDWVQSFEKEAGSRFSRLISSMVSQRWIDRVLADERGYLDEKIYLDYLVLIIAQIGEEGNTVVLGRGSQYILDDHPDTYHILLLDELDNRIKFMTEHYNLSEKRAARVVNAEEKRRQNLYSKLRKKDFDDPGLYHLVLNMSRLSLTKAMDLVCHLVAD